MNKIITKCFLGVSMLGLGASGATLGLTPQMSSNKILKLSKDKLMNNQIFNLSSLTNNSDSLSQSIKNDLYIALSENYPNLSQKDINMDFYYGGNTNKKIIFDSNNARTILYFTVKLSSKSDAFQESTFSFDFRPKLQITEKNHYEKANIFINENDVSKINSLGDWMRSANEYLNTTYVKNALNIQWKKMGLKADRVSNSDGVSSLLFSNELIKFGDNVHIEKDDILNVKKIFSFIPEQMRFNLFKNMDDDLKAETAKYTEIKSSSVFKTNPCDIDYNITLSEIVKEYGNKKFSDFKTLFQDKARFALEQLTNSTISVNPSDINILIKTSYRDDDPIVDWSSTIDNFVKTYNMNSFWIEIQGGVSPFINTDARVGFHARIKNN